MVPNTTHGKVFPRINSRMLVITNKPPPRKTIVPLFVLCQFWEYRGCPALASYVNAMPFPPAPLQPIKQHESGVVVMTNPPNALG